MTEQTQPTDAELMPCPFCGEAAKHSFNDFYGDMSMACCKSCGAQAYAPKWNRRAVLAKWGTPAGAAPVMKERFSEPLARVINAGYLLANCAFNLAQRPGTEISIGTAKTLSDCRKEWDAACAAHKALPPAPQPTQAQAGAVPLTQYRVLEPRVDRIEAEDEFLQDDAQTWATDPNGTFVGTLYGYALRPARRRIKGADHD